jgi:hypothetical protein
MRQLIQEAITTMEQTPSAPEQAPIHEDEQSFIRRPLVRKIIYAGLALSFLMMVVVPLAVQLRDPDFQKHIEQRRVMAGMSKDQVLKAWGGPQTINTSFTKEGLRREEWIFEDWISTAEVKHRYLYFEEGLLIGGWYEGSGERKPTDLPADSPHPKIPR